MRFKGTSYLPLAGRSAALSDSEEATGGGLPPPHLPKRGAPLSNTNRLKHGLYTRAHIARRKDVIALVRETRAMLRRLNGELPKPDQTV